MIRYGRKENSQELAGRVKMKTGAIIHRTLRPLSLAKKEMHQ